MMKVSSKFILSVCSFLLLLSQLGCAGKEVVARIGDEKITRSELESALKSLPEHRREMFKDKVLDDLIETKLFSEEARKIGLEKERKIKEELERIKKETLAGCFLKKCLDRQAEPSESELKTYYVNHKDKFIIPENARIQHLVVKTAQGAQDLLKSLDQGASFEELAKRKSICRCWKKEGRHEWLFKGNTEPELEEAIFTLEIGKLSGIIKTEKGFQILKVLERRDRSEIPFEKAKKNIYSQFFLHKRNELIQKYYQEAKVNMKPKEEGILVKIGETAIPDEAIASILSRCGEKEREKVKTRWIKYFVETEVFSSKARKVKLEHDPDVAAELKKKTDRILANSFRKGFIMDRIKVSDKEMEDYYQSHLEEFGVTKSGEIKPFDQVKPDIRMKLLTQKAKEEKQCYYKAGRVVKFTF